MHAATGDLELTTTGMLVVDTVVPGSVTDGKLESGDILVKIQGQVRFNVCVIFGFKKRG